MKKKVIKLKNNIIDSTNKLIHNDRKNDVRLLHVINKLTTTMKDHESKLSKHEDRI